MVAISGLSFGTLSVFNRQLSAAGLTVPQMLTVRFVGGALVLWGVAFLRREVQPLTRAKLFGFGGLGLLYVAEAWLYFEASQRIPIGLTALLLYLFPSLVMLVSWLALGERPGPRGAFALALSSVGIALAVGAPAGRLDLTGVALGASTAVVYTGYILLGARVQPGTPASLSSAVLMSFAALGFAVGAAVQGPPPPSTAFSAWPAALGLVVVGTAIPIPLLLFGMTRIGASRASIISTLEPISAAVCGLVFLHEGLTPLQWLGGALVLAAVITLSAPNSSFTRPAAKGSPR